MSKKDVERLRNILRAGEWVANAARGRNESDDRTKPGEWPSVKRVRDAMKELLGEEFEDLDLALPNDLDEVLAAAKFIAELQHHTLLRVCEVRLASRVVDTLGKYSVEVEKKLRKKLIDKHFGAALTATSLPEEA
jgi:hypothetical protein